MTNKAINFKSDFSAILGIEGGWGVPFKAKFWAATPSRSFTASWDGATYTNCQLLEDGRLKIAFDNHNLGTGELMLELTFYLTNKDYKDGICNEVIPAFRPVFCDQSQNEYQVILDYSGSSTLTTIGTLPAYYQEGPRSRYEVSDHNTAVADHNQATADHSTAAADHTQAATDHSTASTDHATAAADHAIAASDHSTAAADHTDTTAAAQEARTAAASVAADHAQATADHNQSVADHALLDAATTRAAADHATATADSAQAATDHSTATEDHTQAADDHTTAAADHAAYDADVTNLKARTKVLESKTSEVSKVQIEDDADEVITIENRSGEVVAKVTSTDCDFKNLKSNGEDVVTDLSGTASKDELENLRDDFESRVSVLDKMSRSKTSDTTDAIEVVADDDTTVLLKVTNAGVYAKNLDGSNIVENIKNI